MEIDLLSLVLTLTPLEFETGKPLPRWWGRAAHSLLLRLVAQSDPALANDLHEEQGLRPFTASTLMGRFPNHALDRVQPYHLRFTALSQPVASILLNAIQPGGGLAPGAVVELDELHFRIEAAVYDPTLHPWAAASNYQQLGAAHLLAANPAPRRVALQLTSPTTFHKDGRMLPLPLPELVINSLADRWNSYASIAFPAEVRRYAAECLAVERFDLESRVVITKGGGIKVGAVGSVVFISLNYDRYWMSLVSALAAYALFAGVGQATSMGLGQCRQLSIEPPSAGEPDTTAGE
jgi:CRISPR-associated endoribonuclease Cas6